MEYILYVHISGGEKGLNLQVFITSSGNWYTLNAHTASNGKGFIRYVHTADVEKGFTMPNCTSILLVVVRIHPACPNCWWWWW
jgi:hypothetical protein